MVVCPVNSFKNVSCCSTMACHWDKLAARLSRHAKSSSLNMFMMLFCLLHVSWLVCTPYLHYHYLREYMFILVHVVVKLETQNVDLLIRTLLHCVTTGQKLLGITLTQLCIQLNYFPN